MNAIDVHAHWYPQRFLELLGREGAAHGLEWKETEKGPQFKIRHVITGPVGPLFIDLDARLKEMDRQGVKVHALSLTQPMVYWADDDLGMQLSMAFNDAVSAAHSNIPIASSASRACLSRIRSSRWKSSSARRSCPASAASTWRPSCATAISPTAASSRSTRAWRRSGCRSSCTR